MVVVGLIGGMGSGKSRVAEEFRRRGACTISGDELGHEALRQPEIKARAVERWGRGVLNAEGEIDRRKVAAIVFAEPAELKALEALSFPFIKERVRAEIERARSAGCPLVILDAAVLLEARWREVCDRVAFVDAPRAERLRRLKEQRGWTEAEVSARERVQLPLEEKAARADDVIDNSGTEADLAQQVEALLSRWKACDRAAGGVPRRPTP